jgi:hypothetical protein
MKKFAPSIAFQVKQDIYESCKGIVSPKRVKSIYCEDFEGGDPYMFEDNLDNGWDILEKKPRAFKNGKMIGIYRSMK